MTPDTLHDLKTILAQRLEEDARLYAALPAALKAEARQLHEVHPWLTIADRHPEEPRARVYAELRLCISELQITLRQMEGMLREPNLTLRKSRRALWAGHEEGKV